MNQYNDKRQRHGPWVVYWSNGKLWHKTNYINGKEHGLSERYGSNGKLYFKQYHL